MKDGLVAWVTTTPPGVGARELQEPGDRMHDTDLHGRGRTADRRETQRAGRERGAGGGRCDETAA